MATATKQAAPRASEVERCKRDIARIVLKWAARGVSPDEAQDALEQWAESAKQFYSDAAAAARFNKMAGKGGGRGKTQEDEEAE